MIEKTLIIVGPGGVGKGPMANLIRDDAVRLDPYRLREAGPRRDSDDPLYAHPKLRTELRAMLTGLGDYPREVPCEGEQMEWYKTAKVLFFTVRREWQCLLLSGLSGQVAKAELYAPVLPTILGIPEFQEAVGAVRVLVLNPAAQRLVDMPNWTELESKTRENCRRRNPKDRSGIEKRTKSVSVEAPAWRTLVANHDAIEVINWPFPEYRFLEEDSSQLLRDARKLLVELAADLENFFKPEDRL